MKKKLLFGAIVCVLGMIANGQERVNREKTPFTNQSDIILDATGWAYNDTLGEWIYYKNVISDNKDYKTKYKSMCESPYMKSRYSNFNAIQVKTIIYDGIEYICLIVNEWRGEYKNPAIREDWYEYKVDVFYFLSKEEYNKLFALTNSNTEIKGWSEIKYDYISTPDEDFVVSAIKKKKENAEWWKPEQQTFLQIYKANDGSIRFLFEAPSEHFAGIENKYFETTEDEWNKLKCSLTTHNDSENVEFRDNVLSEHNNIFSNFDLFNFKNLAMLAMDISLGKMEHGKAMGFGITLAGFHFEYMLNLSATGLGEHLAELGQWTGNDGYGLMFGYYLPLSKHIDIAPIVVFERYWEGITNGDNWWVSSQGVTNEVQITLDSKKWGYGVSLLYHFTIPSFTHLGDCGIGLTVTNNYWGINLTFMRMNLEQTKDFSRY